MGKIFIYISTFLLIAVIGSRNAKNKKSILMPLKRNIREINEVYIGLFKEKSLFRKFAQGSLIIVTEIIIVTAVVAGVIRYINTYTSFALELLFKIIIIICVVTIIHFFMGYILLITIKIQKFIYGVENKNVKVDLLLSYFIISTYFTTLMIYPNEFENTYIVGLFGVAISYLLNLKVLIQIIRNPHNIKNKDEKETSYSNIIIASILIVGLIILNLFLGVCFINGADDGAFTNSKSVFDLLYYTVITFTTIGYGDITPVSVGAKIISLVISVTSVICISIFLSIILSYKDNIG